MPNSGKVVIVESIMPEYCDSDFKSTHVTHFDMIMMTVNPGGKERTEREFEALAIGAGFATSKLISRQSSFVVIEFFKE